MQLKHRIWRLYCREQRKNTMSVVFSAALEKNKRQKSKHSIALTHFNISYLNIIIMIWVYHYLVYEFILHHFNYIPACHSQQTDSQNLPHCYIALWAWRGLFFWRVTFLLFWKHSDRSFPARSLQRCIGLNIALLILVLTRAFIAASSHRGGRKVSLWWVMDGVEKKASTRDGSLEEQVEELQASSSQRLAEKEKIQSRGFEENFSQACIRCACLVILHAW